MAHSAYKEERESGWMAYFPQKAKNKPEQSELCSGVGTLPGQKEKSPARELRAEAFDVDTLAADSARALCLDKKKRVRTRTASRPSLVSIDSEKDACEKF